MQIFLLILFNHREIRIFRNLYRLYYNIIYLDRRFLLWKLYKRATTLALPQKKALLARIMQLHVIVPELTGDE